MIVRSVLPKWPNRQHTGEIGVWNDEELKWILGPFPCLGKADNEKAAMKGNASRDPKLPYGDHSCGVYDITEVVAMTRENYHSYGEWFIRLKPVMGDALTRENAEPGNCGIAIHGGEQSGTYYDGLRPTNGCCRLRNLDMGVLAQYVRTNSLTKYVCEELA